MNDPTYAKLCNDVINTRDQIDLYLKHYGIDADVPMDLYTSYKHAVLASYRWTKKHKHIFSTEIHLCMLTLTFDPHRGKPNYTKAEKFIETRLKTKQFKEKNVSLYVYSHETHKNGLRHYHVIIESSKPFSRSSDVFRDWVRKFGNPKGTHISQSIYKDLSKAFNYITKENYPILLRIHSKGLLILDQIAPSVSSGTPELSQ